MSDKKILSINPNLFSFSNTTKKQKKPKEEQNRIKMKPISNTNAKNTDTLRKKTILKMIRQHQEETNKENFTSYEKSLKPKETKKQDFELAQQFFDNMVVKTPQDKNYTLKNPVVENKPLPNLGIDIKEKMTDISNTLNTTGETGIQLNNTLLPTPKYGCLKNGSLPTYRNYMNTTRKNISGADENTQINANSLIPSVLDQYSGGSEVFKRANIMQQTEKLTNLKKKKKQYRKKTIKRTFKIGKSKVKPSVSVLVSNKTVRNRILEKKQLINQVPINEIRTYLIKHGFLKIGSITPNDVLRKMYETALTICGEIQNHNPETLMYNFMNDKDPL
tara:strand:+ start:8666 stop:9664 length:999 start_codon:yes stop_codon:yes gene_type:complete